MKTDYVDLYQPARIDIGIPIEETIGAISDLVKEGYVRHIGLSEIDASTLKKAYATHPIRLIEQVYSIADESIEHELLPTARVLEVSIVAFGVLGLGQLLKTPEDALVRTLHELSNEKNCSASQLAHAYMLQKGADVIPLIGARNLEQLEDSMQSTTIELSKTDLIKLENAKKDSKITGQSMPKMVIKNGILQR